MTFKKPTEKKIFIKGSTDDVAVPFRELTLSNDEKILLSTVEGSDPNAKAMPKIRGLHLAAIVKRRPSLITLKQASLPRKWSMLQFASRISTDRICRLLLRM